MIVTTVMERRNVLLHCDICAVEEVRVMDLYPDSDPLRYDGWEHEWASVREVRLSRMTDADPMLVCGRECLRASIERVVPIYYRDLT